MFTFSVVPLVISKEDFIICCAIVFDVSELVDEDFSNELLTEILD